MKEELTEYEKFLEFSYKNLKCDELDNDYVLNPRTYKGNLMIQSILHKRFKEEKEKFLKEYRRVKVK